MRKGPETWQTEWRAICDEDCGVLYEGSRRPKVTEWHNPRRYERWAEGNKRCYFPVRIESRKVTRWTTVYELAACSDRVEHP